MKNYVQPGNIISVTAPYNRTAGQGVLVGALFGVCTTDVTSGASVDIALEGVFDISKAAALAISQGDRVWWDDTNKVLNKTATSNYHVGICVVAAQSADATVRVLLERGPALGS